MNDLNIRQEYERVYNIYFPDTNIDDMRWTRLYSLRKKICKECLHCRENMTCNINDKYVNVYPEFPFSACPDLVWDSVTNESDIDDEINLLEDEFNES